LNTQVTEEVEMSTGGQPTLLPARQGLASHLVLDSEDSVMDLVVILLVQTGKTLWLWINESWVSAF